MKVKELSVRQCSKAGSGNSVDDVSWFFTEEWQIGERKADEDLACGRFKDFKTIDELLAFLHTDILRNKNGRED